jgi:hypothetical protein
MNKLKKIYSFFDQKYSPLVEVFKKTIKDDYEINIIKIESSISGQNVQIEKTKTIIKTISENINEHIIFSDIDVQFFDKTKPLIEPMLNNDILIQWQVGDFGNIGFMVILCNELMKSFFIDVLKKCELGEWDQKIVNEKLKSNCIKWNFLPKKFYAFHPKNQNPPKDAVLHHATWEYSPEEKIKQMKKIKKYLFLKYY